MKTFFASLAVALLASTAMAQTSTSPTSEPNQTSSGPERVGEPVPKAEVKEGIEAGTQQLFDLLDTNKDGQLSKDEFARMAQPAPSTPAASQSTQPSNR